MHPDGFLTYRIADQPHHTFQPPFGTVIVEDFCPITDEAHTELLQTLLLMDMFDRIEIEVPRDDPLPLKLRNPRAARTKGVTDFLWARISDVPEVLGARVYSADADVALEVADPLNLAGGQFLLQARDGAGKCTMHDGPPDIKVGLADLATIYMGAHTPVTFCERAASRNCAQAHCANWMPLSAPSGPRTAGRFSKLSVCRSVCHKLFDRSASPEHTAGGPASFAAWRRWLPWNEVGISLRGGTPVIVAYAVSAENKRR